MILHRAKWQSSVAETSTVTYRILWFGGQSKLGLAAILLITGGSSSGAMRARCPPAIASTLHKALGNVLWSLSPQATTVRSDLSARLAASPAEMATTLLKP